MSTPIGYITLTLNNDSKYYVDIKVDDIVAISPVRSGTDVYVGNFNSFVNVTQSFGEIRKSVDEARRRVMNPDREDEEE